MVSFIPTILTLPVLLWICYIDVNERRIPNKITFPSLITLFCFLIPFAQLTNNLPSLSRAISGAFSAFLFFLSLHALNPKGLGFGDVKLASIVGSVMAWDSIDALIYGLCAIFLIAAGYSILVAVKNGKIFNQSIPFAPFMTAGTVFGVAFY